MSDTIDLSRNTIRGARRTAIIVVIVSLSITALVGIVALLSGEFGELQAKILLTTLATAAFSITSLCHLAVVGRALRVVGFIGVAVSAAALVPAVVLIWHDWSDDFDWTSWLQALGVLTTVAVSLAQANLLLLLAERRAPIVRIGLIVTVSCIAIVAVLISIPILTSGDIPGDDGDTYWRVFGVIAILDVLGSIVLPILARFSRDERDFTSRSTTAERAALTLVLTPELASRLDALAAQTGTTREQAALALLSARVE